MKIRFKFAIYIARCDDCGVPMQDYKMLKFIKKKEKSKIDKFKKNELKEENKTSKLVRIETSYYCIWSTTIENVSDFIMYGKCIVLFSFEL